MKESNEALGKSVALNPNNAEATIFLAVTFAELGDKATAKTLADKAMELDPTDSQVVGNHAILSGEQP
jgi:Flp pilus assembly protein TadD